MTQRAEALQLEISTCDRCGFESVLEGQACVGCESSLERGREPKLDGSEAPKTRRRARYQTLPGGFQVPQSASPQQRSRESGTHAALAAPIERLRAAADAQRDVEAMLHDIDGGFESLAADATAADWRDLAARITELRDVHAAYQEANASWSADAHQSKKQLRMARADALGRVTALLDRLGQIECREHLERISFEKRIEELDRLLGELRC